MIEGWPRAEEERQAREATARETHELHSQILLHEADIRDVFKYDCL